MNQRPHKKSGQKQHKYSAFLIQAASLYAQSRFQKSAQTPFERIRRKQKIRKERINLSLTTTKQDFSLIIGKQSTSLNEKSREDKSYTTDREEASPSRLRTKKEGNHRVLITDNTSKKKTSLQASPQKTDDSKCRLLIQGANCGNDLISSNRQKLEQMIAQIKANNTSLHQKYDISELIVEKGYTRQRNNVRRVKKQEVLPIFSSECKTKPKLIDSKQYLICTPAVLEVTKNELSIEGSSMVDGFSKWEKVFALTPKQIELSRKICKTEDMSKSQSPRKLNKHSPTKKGPIFNGFNLNNLKGWDSSEQPQELYFHMGIH